MADKKPDPKPPVKEPPEGTRIATDDEVRAALGQKV